MLGIFTPSADFVARGEAKVEKAVEVYNQFFSDESTDKIDDYFINDIL
jgi:hypothetical protein